MSSNTIFDLEADPQDEAQETPTEVLCRICNARIAAAFIQSHVNDHIEDLFAIEPVIKRRRCGIQDENLRQDCEPIPSSSVSHCSSARRAGLPSTGHTTDLSAVANSCNVYFLRDCPRQVCDKYRWLHEFVMAPWAAQGMPRKPAFKQLLKANPLWKHMGSCTTQGFYTLMLERELIRIRRCELHWARVQSEHFQPREGGGRFLGNDGPWNLLQSFTTRFTTRGLSVRKANSNFPLLL